MHFGGIHVVLQLSPLTLQLSQTETCSVASHLPFLQSLATSMLLTDWYWFRYFMYRVFIICDGLISLNIISSKFINLLHMPEVISLPKTSSHFVYPLIMMMLSGLFPTVGYQEWTHYKQSCTNNSVSLCNHSFDSIFRDGCSGPYDNVVNVLVKFHTISHRLNVYFLCFKTTSELKGISLS